MHVLDLLLESGHYMYMLETDLRTNYRSRLQTDFLQTDKRCLLLFYKFSGQGQASITIVAMQENLDEIQIWQEKYLETTPFWMPLYVNLPKGVHQVVIEGRRGTGSPGIAIDDIHIKRCKKQGK